LATGGRRGLVSLRSLDLNSPVLDNRHDVSALTELEDGRIGLQHNAGFALVAPDLKSATVVVPSPQDSAAELGMPARCTVLTRDGRLAIGSATD
ncbi:hypothetical protein, partial [Klebsiella quasipneumoniae]|uniref:hypothetical protein n=1 Tax=Klebsiella quasipneumoniae TaxID=1463165 RepID=UPI00272FD243